MSLHPNTVLYQSDAMMPLIPACEHFAGNEKLITKAAQLQQKFDGRFDISCDCEDGAPAGEEEKHAVMIGDLIGSSLNKYQRMGVRIHDYSHASWRRDIDLLLPAVGDRLAYITIPKSPDAETAAKMVDYIQHSIKAATLKRQIPLHFLIETTGALRDVWRIAALEGVEVLDFGLMDFVSDHHGVIPAAAMHSPLQFEHSILQRAKAEVVAAASSCIRIAAHNVTLDIRNPYRCYQDAYRARNDFGFLRMWSIHPQQIPAILDAMQPDYSSIEQAADILLAARRKQWGPIQHQGQLHDRATYRYYWNLLQRARLGGSSLPEEAEHSFFA